MLRMTWRNLFARKVRLGLSAFAVVLGVAFVAGSFIFTDAMGDAFDGIIEGSTADVEIAYRGANDFASQQDARTIPVSVVNRLDQLPEVGSVHPSVQLSSVYVIGRNGKVVGGNGPPGLAFNYSGTTSLTGKPIVTLSSGAFPRGPGQVALDTDTARKAGYGVGDTVTLVTPGDPPTLKEKVSGLVEFGSGGLNGATLTLFDVRVLQKEFFGGRDVYSTISLDAAPGVSQTRLRDAAQKVLPKDVVARTGDELVSQNKAQLDEILGVLNTFLLVFAGVSLVVGTFLIVNTFSILVAQRSRELALLRAIGASRRQVSRSVLLEALVLGLFGATLGLLLGVGLAYGIRWLIGLIGLDLGSQPLHLTGEAVLAGYATGVVVTMAAAWLPARRTGRIMPVQALGDVVALPESSIRWRFVLGLLAVAGGAAAVAEGLFGSLPQSGYWVGGGILAVLLGVTAAAPIVCRPFLALARWSYAGVFHAVGNLAGQNALRNPRRTTATASALMIGMALACTMSIIGASAKASVDRAIQQNFIGNYVVGSSFGQPFSTQVAKRIQRVPGVARVVKQRYAFIEADGKRATLPHDCRSLRGGTPVPTLSAPHRRR